MLIFFRKRSKIFAGILAAVLQIANLFIGNIIVYESTEGAKFHWMMLLKNWLFWLILIATIVYYAIAYAVKQQGDKIDDKIEDSISDNSTKLLDLVVKNAESGDFESSEKAMKLFDKMQHRRGI